MESMASRPQAEGGEMKNPKPKVGDVLYRLNIGNNANKWNPPRLVPVTVTKVGRKYFTVKLKDGAYSMESEHYNDDWKHNSNFSAGYYLYYTEQDYHDEMEYLALEVKLKQIGREYEQCKLSLDQLRRIDAILSEAKEAK